MRVGISPLTLVAMLALLPARPSVAQSPTPPYPPSEAVTGISFDPSTLIELAPGSDNWAITWAADDHQYTSWGDGGGFGGTDGNGRVTMGIARIEGPKENYVGVNVWGGANAENPATFPGKSYGILGVDGKLYLWRSGSGTADAVFDFQELFVSEDSGASWTSTAVEFGRADFQGSLGFFTPAFLQFGRDYAGSRDDFIYSYAPENKTDVWEVQKPGEISLLRVHRDSIADPQAWEFFAGLSDGTPSWTSELNGRQPVFSDPMNGVMRTSVSYNPGLDRYFLITQQVSRFKGGNGHIGIYDAPNPWGPWTTVLFANPWEIGLQDDDLLNASKTVYWNFANKWLSADGRNFVLVYTGAGSDNWGTVEGTFAVPEPDAPLQQAAAMLAIALVALAKAS